MAAIALSPLLRYSIDWADQSSTQPVPVVVMTASTLRLKALVRSELGDHRVGHLADRLVGRRGPHRPGSARSRRAGWRPRSASASARW